MAEKSGSQNSLNTPNNYDKIDDDSGITMVDVLEEEEELENDADAVLGGSDDKNCTYIEGYVKRQALYACKTCAPSDSELGGVCLACSYACHEGHELLELYTKRNFRCDCGNSKFPNNQCQFYKNKAKINEDNSYNQNFSGKYCVCSRPYPDAEDDTPDEMIQCIICEDWYHSKHLSSPLPETDYSEIICEKCMKKNSFLWKYYAAVEGSNSLTKLKTEKTDLIICVDDKPQTSTSENSTVKIQSTLETKIPEKCLLNQLPNTEVQNQTGSAFWSDGWRHKLCKCQKCLEVYATNDCSYLVDMDDTVQAYEDRGKIRSNGQSQYDKGLSALNSLGRVQQVEAIQGYNSMKSELKEFLKTFAESKKIVREEDIHDFFNNMQAKKRRKTNVQIPHFCR